MAVKKGQDKRQRVTSSGQSNETSAKAYVNFVVECPFCRSKEKYQDFFDSLGTTLHDRLIEILSGKGGVTDVPGQCSECKRQFRVTSFRV